MRHGRSGALVAFATLAVLVACAGDEVPTDDADLIARGGELYQRHCVSCHGGPTGGTISDIPPRHNAQGHTWHHPDCDLVAIILDGMPERDGYPVMPSFESTLTEDDAEAILAHIRTWWEPDQREYQAEITEQLCPAS